MSKSKKVNVRLRDGEGYVVLSGDDLSSIAQLFTVMAQVDDRSATYKEAWLEGANKFSAAIGTVYSAGDDEAWD